MIELLVALSVLAIIAAIIVPKYLNLQSQAQLVVLDNNLKEVSNAVANWQATGGTFNTGDLYAAFHLIQFLSQPGSATDPTRNIAAIDPSNTCRDSGNSYTISINTYAAPTKTTQPTSSLPDGYYGKYNMTTTPPLPASHNNLYLKTRNQVYSVDVQNNDLAAAIFIRTGVAVGVTDQPQTLP